MLKLLKELPSIIFAVTTMMLMVGCNVLPTVEPGPTLQTGTVVQPSATATAEIPLVTVTGDVFVRDVAGVVQGYLQNGSTVYAICAGEWCDLENGLQFWRGCSSDNPYNLGCQSR